VSLPAILSTAELAVACALVAVKPTAPNAFDWTCLGLLAAMTAAWWCFDVVLPKKARTK